jgi:beta-lactamase superfamily II metal-dependent hydrolase
MPVSITKFRSRRRGNTRTFFCQVETYFGTKEYARRGRCVRLIGVERDDFLGLVGGDEDGVTTYVVDLDFWQYFRRQFGVTQWWDVVRQLAKIKDLESGLHRDRSWLRVEVEISNSPTSYVYETFANDDPTYINIVSITPASSDGSLPSLRAITLRPRPAGQQYRRFLAKSSPLAIGLATTVAPQSHPGDTSASNHYTFHAFHVGQGMCSLIDNGKSGWLLDAGAGKPVTRARYFDTTSPIVNDLMTRVEGLTDLVMVASHTDYDHWKLLAWEEKLRSKVSAILVPDMVDHLLFKDKAIIDKCVDTTSTTIPLVARTRLHLLRSDPSSPDANGNCLVAVFERDGHLVLAPGDYVYSRFASDGSSHIRGLRSHLYKAVVVPHHGDKESAKALITADSPGAQAFFSAGTHGYYKHPTQESLSAHLSAGFIEVCDRNKEDIEAVLLL